MESCSTLLSPLPLGFSTCLFIQKLLFSCLPLAAYVIVSLYSYPRELHSRFSFILRLAALWRLIQLRSLRCGACYGACFSLPSPPFFPNPIWAHPPPGFLTPENTWRGKTLNSPLKEQFSASANQNRDSTARVLSWYLCPSFPVQSSAPSLLFGITLVWFPPHPVPRFSVYQMAAIVRIQPPKPSPTLSRSWCLSSVRNSHHTASVSGVPQQGNHDFIQFCIAKSCFNTLFCFCSHNSITLNIKWQQITGLNHWNNGFQSHKKSKDDNEWLTSKAHFLRISKQVQLTKINCWVYDQYLTVITTTTTTVICTILVEEKEKMKKHGSDQGASSSNCIQCDRKRT